MLKVTVAGFFSTHTMARDADVHSKTGQWH